MIISHHRRFIFAAIPKTGTHAVRQALRAQLGPDDIEQVGLFVKQTLPVPAAGSNRSRPHNAAADPALPNGRRVTRYLKVAFVRNPFDRFVVYERLHDPAPTAASSAIQTQ